METRLIMLPQPILVSDEKIKEGDWLKYNYANTPAQFIRKDEDGIMISAPHNDFCSRVSYNSCKKIIAGIEGLPKLNLSLIAEGIGWVDIDKLAEKTTLHIPIHQNDSDLINLRRWYIEGFKAAQSLNEKKYSEGDMINAFYAGQQRHDLFEAADYLATLKPKEYLVEVEMDCTLVGLALSDSCIPKITNNTITVTKILQLWTTQ